MAEPAMASNDSRRPWTQDEDELIVKLVNEHGLRKWAIVAAALSGRSGKQCRLGVRPIPSLLPPVSALPRSLGSRRPAGSAIQEESRIA